MAFRKPRLVWAAQAVAVLALLAHALHSGLGVGGSTLDAVFDDEVYDALILLAATICLARAVCRAEERRTWIAFSASLFLWGAGEISYTILSAPTGEPPFPSIVDGFYLAFYAAAFVGLVELLHGRARGLVPTAWLDGLIASAAAATIGAAVLFGVVLEVTGGTTAEIVVNLAYPLADIVLFAFVVGVFCVTGWRPGREWALIGGSFVALAVADGIYLFQISSGSYEEGTILDSAWPAAALLLAFAAWQRPSPAAAVEPAGRRLLVVPTALGSVGVAVLAYDHFRQINDLALWLAVATVMGVVVRTVLTFRENQRLLDRSRRQAVSDELTGLANRRQLLADLEREFSALRPADAAILLVFDLDGFKGYNDTFGHPVGDALLQRLGRSLAAAVGNHGTGYRLGGDEFCVLARIPEGGAGSLIDACVDALTEESEGFEIGTSFGAAFLPDEAASPSDALRAADRRLYAHKQERRLEAGRQPEDVLLRTLYEREPRLHRHARRVSSLAVAVGRLLGADSGELARLARAAELHDVGKLAIPDAILHKPGPLDADELHFVQNHSAIGERILSASPALAPVGKIVRATHERWDGGGYPDGVAGEEIPLGARIIAVCDTFVAMTSARPHRQPVSVDRALAELRSCAGTQFDPAVVAAFAAIAHAESDLPAAQAAGPVAR